MKTKANDALRVFAHTILALTDTETSHGYADTGPIDLGDLTKMYVETGLSGRILPEHIDACMDPNVIVFVLSMLHAQCGETDASTLSPSATEVRMKSTTDLIASLLRYGSSHERTVDVVGALFDAYDDQ